jgi:hypothetical protein
MSRKIDFLDNVASSLESWTESATNSLTNPNENLIWIDNDEPFKRIQKILLSNGIPREVIHDIFYECLKGYTHSLLCILDGATELSDKGRIYLVDEEGNKLGDGLHEQFIDYLFDKHEKSKGSGSH